MAAEGFFDTVPVLDDHTGQNLAYAVQDILGNWELDLTNLIGAVMGNGSNFVSAFTIHSRLNRVLLFWVQFGPLCQ